MKKHTEFEKQISRIYELLSENSAKVTWNDRIIDPDNPQQLRQVDITIKKDDVVVHVECRSHNRPQDAKWIEELYGRKISLNATAMIAVSDSGFTEGAIRKAEKFGIFLRRMDELSDKEITRWGENTTLSIQYYILNNFSLQFVFEDIENISPERLAGELHKNSHIVDLAVNTIKYKFNEEKDYIHPYCFRFDMQADNVVLCGKRLIGIRVQGELDVLIYKHKCPAIFGYQVVGRESNIPIVKIEKSKKIDLEIIKTGSNVTAIYFDLSSSPQAPINSMLSGIFKFDKIPVDIHHPSFPKFTIIGSHEQKVYLDGAILSVASIRELKNTVLVIQD